MMKRLWRLLNNLRALFGRGQSEAELDEELREYLNIAAEEKMRAGMLPLAAVRAARVEFGSLEAVKDLTRDVGWETRIESIYRGLRYAARALLRSPAFTVAAALTLSLGIGANTAIFSAVNAILLRPLPVQRPGELVSLAVVYPNGTDTLFSYAAYRQVAAEAADVVEVMAASSARREAIALDALPEPIDLKWVSGNYFPTLGINAAIGRSLLPSDDPEPPGESVAVISDAYWNRRFGRDPSIVQRQFWLKGTTYLIVGVAPPGFSGESPGETADIWMPLSAQPGAPSWLWNGHSTTWLRILARRRPHVSLEQTRATLDRAYGLIRDEIAAGEHSPEFRQTVLEGRLAVSDASRGTSQVRDNLSAPLLVLMAIVGLVLVVACANVASLMLARAATRRRETAVCLAIGAGNRRLIWQGLAEALLLAALGGLGGLALALWGTSVLTQLISGVLPITLDIRPDGRVLAFLGLMSCATAMISGLLPAVRATRVDPIGALKGGGSHRRAYGIPLGRTLVVTQFAVSLVLLVAAALFVRSLLNLRNIEPGFDPDRLVVLSVVPLVEQQPIEARRDAYRMLLERAAGVPGVEGASASSSRTLSSETWRNTIDVEGFVAQAGVTPRTLVNAITPQYFNVMRMAVLRGRSFADADQEGAGKAAIVNEAFERQFFDQADPIGKRVALCSSDPCGTPSNGGMEIVGVIQDAKYADLREASRPMLYVPYTQVEQTLREIEVRTTGDPDAVAATLFRELSSVDRRMAIVAVAQARDRVDASLVAESLVARFSAAFGLLALALGAVGLYGLIAYMTTQRGREIGIRMALGAERGEVQRLVLRDTVRLLTLGVAIGLPVALGAARLLTSQLHQVSPGDPVALSLSVAVLVLVGMVAGYLPARRAAGVDPNTVLRGE